MSIQSRWSTTQRDEMEKPWRVNSSAKSDAPLPARHMLLKGGHTKKLPKKTTAVKAVHNEY